MNTFKKYAYYIGMALFAMFAAVNTSHGATATVACLDGQTPVWNGTTLTLACPVSSGGGGPVTPPVDPPPVVNCPAGSLLIPDTWGKSEVATAQYGVFNNQAMAIKIAVPLTATGTKLRTTSWVEYQTGPVVRLAYFSNKACSFDPKDALKNQMGSAFISKDTIRFSFIYRIGTPTSSAAGLTPGQTYWINVKNTYGDGVSPTCSGDCSMKGSVPD